MKRIASFIVLAAFWMGLLPAAAPAEDAPGTTFVTIGTGDLTGVYYPAGRILAKRVNGKREGYGIRATAEATRGSVYNVNAIGAGVLEFGLVQSDVQHDAVNGSSAWAEKGPQKELRSVFSLHRETVCLVAAVDAGIRTVADLKGKRVNLGNPRSGQYRNAIDALKAAGLDPDRDISAEKVKAADAPPLLQDGKIDAFFCTLGHPNKTLVQAVSGSRKTRFVPVAGPGIERLIAERGYYTKSFVPVREFYPGAENAGDVETLSVIATLCASSRVPERVVYLVTKDVFAQLDSFTGEHPAFAGLTREKMIEGLSAPLHPGALKYFREAGLLR